MNIFVPIIMGSRSDIECGKAVSKQLVEFGIDHRIRIASAHKTPRYLMDILDYYEEDGRQKVYITIAGRSNALSAFIDAYVASPVIACPPYSEKYGGADIFSSLRMPSGVAPAVVVDPGGAALVAAKIFAVNNPDIRHLIRTKQRRAELQIRTDDGEITI